MAQRRKKIMTGLVYRPESFKSKWEKKIIWWNCSVLLLLPWCCCFGRWARCARRCIQIERRHSVRNCETWLNVHLAMGWELGRQGVSGLIWEGLVVPWWKGSRPSIRSARSGRWRSDGIAIVLGFVCTKERVSHAYPPMHRKCTFRVGIVLNPTWGQRQLSRLHCSIWKDYYYYYYYKTANIVSPKNVNTNLKVGYLKCQGKENSKAYIPAFDRRLLTRNMI